MQLPTTIPTPTNKLTLVQGIATKVFGADVTQKDLLAMILLTQLRMIEGQKGTADPGLADVAQSIGDAMRLIQQLDTPDPEAS